MLKKLLAVTLATLLVLALAAAPALAESTVPQNQNTLIVLGNATITLEPDYATMNLGVTTKGATVSEAQALNSGIMDKVITALKEQGIDEKDIVTSSFNVYANYDYQYSQISGGETLNGYQVDNMLMITVRDIAKVSKVLDAAMGAGANQSYGITFGSTKQTEAYDTALSAAVKEGMRKAELLAAASGKKLGQLVTVEEKEYNYAPYGTTAKYATEDAAGGTPILSGEISVNATVTLTYQFE